MIKWIKSRISKFLYVIITRFIHENLKIEVSVEDNGNSNLRTVYVYLKIGNEIVSSDYAKLDLKI